MEEKSVLQNLGLSEREAKVYLALLSSVEATATKMARETGIERVHTYSILNKLVERGLASHYIKNSVRHFSAADPRKLLADIDERKSQLESVMPALESMKASRQEAISVEVYDGREGLKSTVDDVFRVGDTILVLGEQGQFQELTRDLANQYRRNLEKHNMTEKVLLTEEFRGKFIKSKKSMVRYMAKEIISPSTTLIYGNRVLISIVTKSQIFNVVIKSREIADSYRAYFNYLWKRAKR